MTIAANQANRFSYMANGLTTTFPYGSAFTAQADIVVQTVTAAGVATTLALTTDYTITGNVDSVGRYTQGGSVVFNVAPATGLTVVIFADPAIAQPTQWVENDPFPALQTEKSFDLLTIIGRRFKDLVTRSFRLADSDTSGASLVIPKPVALQLLQWNAAGTALQGTTLAGTGVLALPGVNGMAAYTAPNTFVGRTLTAGSVALTVANGDGQAGNPTIDLPDNAILARKLAGSAMGFSLINGTLVATVSTNILTVAIKTLAGADPSAADPVYVLFRNVNAALGTYTVITLTAAQSVATAVGGTFGAANNVAFRLWVVGFNDGGTFRLGLINCLTTVAGAGAGRDVTSIFALSGWGIASSTLIGAGSTLAGTFYTAGAGVASVAYATLGYLTYEAGLPTAGSFSSVSSRLQLFSQNDSLPGQTIQVQRTQTGALATGATLIPWSDAIPQNTGGDQYLSQAITPTSAANTLRIGVNAQFSCSAVANATVALFQDSTANALTSIGRQDSAGRYTFCLGQQQLAAGTALTTFKVRIGGDTGTITFNGLTSARIYGGVANSFIEVTEIMG
jgi:hypothetical protein